MRESLPASISQKMVCGRWPNEAKILIKSRSGGIQILFLISIRKISNSSILQNDGVSKPETVGAIYKDFQCF